jgi:hypothetical protein
MYHIQLHPVVIPGVHLLSDVERVHTRTLETSRTNSVVYTTYIVGVHLPFSLRSEIAQHIPHRFLLTPHFSLEMLIWRSSEAIQSHWSVISLCRRQEMFYHVLEAAPRFGKRELLFSRGSYSREVEVEERLHYSAPHPVAQAASLSTACTRSVTECPVTGPAHPHSPMILLSLPSLHSRRAVEAPNPPH